MTENEAIEILKENQLEHYHINIDEYKETDIAVRNMAIQALSEIQQYRAIENELKEKYHANVDIKGLIEYFIETIFKGEKHEGFCILTNEDEKMWNEYKAIGTIEEFKALKEKKSEWKYSRKENIATCKNCSYEHYLGTYHQYATNYCPKCGSKMTET